MAWLRDVLFLGLVGGGLLLLGGALLPPEAVQPLTPYDPAPYEAEDFQAALARVNASFREQWADAGLAPSGAAPDLLVARRLALGLMGTVPSLEEIRQLEAVPSSDRLGWWLDHVLQDRRHVDYFAERLARAVVGVEDGPFLLYRRRRLVAWLADALARNRPYGEIVQELIAAEGLWTDRPATNFVSVTCQPERGNEPDPVRLAGRVTRAFLGLRLDCAQCHDHPFAEWKKGDFEGLAAFFGQTHVGFQGIWDGGGEYEVEAHRKRAKTVVAPRVPFAADLLPPGGPRRQRLAAWVTHPHNPYFAPAAVNRVWALIAGRPLTEPVDNLDTDRPRPPALQLLADDFRAHAYDLRRLIRLIALCAPLRRASAGREESDADKAWAMFPLTRLRPDQVAGSVLQAASISTLDAQSHLLLRLVRAGQQNEFVQHYGDSGADEFDAQVGTIPQRLLLMNGSLVGDKIREGPFNASTRIAWMAADDRRAVEAAYLAVLTRRPTPAEAVHFEAALAQDSSLKRTERLEDLYWALLNCTEFSWNH